MLKTMVKESADSRRKRKTKGTARNKANNKWDKQPT